MLTVGIIGIGLIGGSLARAYSESGHRVLGMDRDGDALDEAARAGAIQGILSPENISGCDLVLIAVPPAAVASVLRDLAPSIGPDPMVIDCCGVKQRVCDQCFPIAEEYGLTYIGGHPMAGTQYSGFSHSRSNLFHNAPMVLVPPEGVDLQQLDRARDLLSPAGFGKISVTTPRDHDQMIAFTSQMAHVVSNAYIKSPTALRHKGFSAGSYKDMTRVAWLDAEMWTDLFMENRESLLREMDIFLSSMAEYREALEQGDRERMVDLLNDGKHRKETVDGR